MPVAMAPYGSVLCAVGSMGYKHKILPREPVLRALDEPNFLIKIIPHVDNSLRVCELVRYQMQRVELKGAWSGPAALELFQHAVCDVARLPVREVVGVTHFVADLTLVLGEVVYDYPADAQLAAAPLEVLAREAAR